VPRSRCPMDSVGARSEANLDLHQTCTKTLSVLLAAVLANRGICFRDGMDINVIGISYRCDATRACHIDDRGRCFPSL
jgi:hypothetical protein